jgi:carbon-monoxide dehydrogenase medium subunit
MKQDPFIPVPTATVPRASTATVPTTPVLHRPGTLAEACELLADLDQPLVYGGGTAIQILIKQGALFASDLVDIARVPGLDQVSETATGLRVGAMVTLRQMETDPLVWRRAPLAAQVYRKVANPRVRNTATVGGNLAQRDFRLDPPTALLALDAEVELTASNRIRMVPIREFFVGFQATALARDELVTAVWIPTQPTPAAAFVKLSSLSVNDWPCASAAALVVPVKRRCREIRLGLGALAARPEYLSLELPADVDVNDVQLTATRAANHVIDPIPDVRGGVDFKRQLGLVAVRDAVTTAWEMAGQEGTDARRTSRRRWWRGRRSEGAYRPARHSAR